MSRLPSPMPLPKPPSQLELFSWLIKLRTRDVLTVRETAEITRLSERSIRLLLELGELDGFAFQIGGSTEKTQRIAVSSLCRYLLTSATLSDADRADLLVAFVEKLDRRTLDFLIPLMTTRRQRLA